jgi:hypothetical protein
MRVSNRTRNHEEIVHFWTHWEPLMPRMQESHWNLVELTDANTFTAICSLDWGSIPENSGENHYALFAICFCVLPLSCASAAFVFEPTA